MILLWDNSWGDVKMTKKRGVVAQLIYMLVLIAIAVVVGLFFMNIVEKNKKTAAKSAVSEVQFSVYKNPDGTLTIRTSQDPGNINFNVTDGTNNETFNKSTMEYTGMYYQYKTTLTCDSGETAKIVDAKTGNILFFQKKCDDIPTE